MRKYDSITLLTWVLLFTFCLAFWFTIAQRFNEQHVIYAIVLLFSSAILWAFLSALSSHQLSVDQEKAPIVTFTA